MNQRPNMRAMPLFAFSPIGVVGMIATEGAWNFLFFLVAAVPIATGIATIIVGRRRRAELGVVTERL